MSLSQQAGFQIESAKRICVGQGAWKKHAPSPPPGPCNQYVVRDIWGFLLAPLPCRGPLLMGINGRVSNG